MNQGLIGKKLFMHQIFTETGTVIPVTVIEATPNLVTQVKTIENDGYQAWQLATGAKRASLVAKPIQGHLRASKGTNLTYFKEFHAMTDYKVGDQVTVELFKPGDYVDIIAVSKGKGTAGVIKRHNFKRGPMSHGSKHHRAPGSVGLSRPDKVWKGHPLPGRKGNCQTTVQSLEVIAVDPKQNYLFVKGSIPGRNGSFCQIITALKKRARKTAIKLWTAPTVQETEVKSEKNSNVASKQTNAQATKPTKDLGTKEGSNTNGN